MRPKFCISVISMLFIFSMCFLLKHADLDLSSVTSPWWWEKYCSGGNRAYRSIGRGKAGW